MAKNYAKERYLEKVKLNQQKAQVEELYRQGYTADEVRAIGRRERPNPFVAGFKPPTYIVKDGDSLETIAEQFNTTPLELLQANPEMPAPQTGMVINTRPRYTGPINPNWIFSPNGTILNLRTTSAPPKLTPFGMMYNWQANTSLLDSPLFQWLRNH